MFNKKRLFVAGAFIIALLFMTMYAGNIGEQGTTPMRIVKFIDGFNSAEINTQNIEVGGKAEVPKDPEHEDLLFIGWYNGDTKVTEFENIMKDLIVTSQYVDDINNNGIADSAENTYTITFFDTLAGANISDVQVLTGMNATAPTAPVHENHTFTGWSRGFTNVTSSFTVNARYRTTEAIASPSNTLSKNTYTVEFLVGTKVISTQTIEEGAKATAPIPDEIDKKIFTGWDTSFDNVTTDLTVNAVYADDVNKNNLDDATETRYAVAFVAGTGGTLDGTTEFDNLLINLSLADNGVTIPMPVAKNDRYEFNSWDAELTNETKVEGDTTYTANFKDIKKPTVEIQNVSKYNPKSFDIYATDLESGLKRIDYSLFINDNTDYLGGDGQWIEGSVYEFEQRNITEYYSLEKVKYLFEDLSVGEYTLRVTVSDNEGNTTHATNFNFEVDKITPEFNLTTGYHNDDDIQIIITEKNFSQVKIYNQDTNKTIIEKNLAFTLTEEATYRLTAKDKADNETTIWVAIDKTNPEIYNNDEPIINDSYYKEDVVLNIQDKFLQTVKINGPIEKSLTRSDFEVGKNKENFSYSEILTESGNYEVIAKDKFGNTTTINFVIDKELPSGEVIDIWSNNDINQRYATKGNNVSVRFRTTEEIQEGETNMMIAGIEVENVLKKDSSNPGENVYQGTIVVTKNTPEGLVVFNIEVTDLAGNVGTIPTTVNSGHTVTIDRTNPILEESDIIIDYFNPKTFSFTASDEYGLKTMSYTIWTKGRIKLEQSDGHIYNGVTSKKLTYQINNLSDGEYELRISVFDLAGNYIDASPVYFEVDNTAPIARISSPSEDGKSFGKNVIITGEVDESETNLISHEFEITNPDGTQSFVADMTTNKFNHSFDLDTSKGIGMYTIKYTATDKASNTSSVIRTLNVVDINNPKTTIEVTPISNGNNFTVRGIAEDEEKLNRVYVQLKNRTTGVNCGGTTIHLLDPVQQHAKWSRTYYLPEMKLDSNCYSTGNYAAHVEVVDNLGNRGSAGWTDNFYLDFTNPETTINVSTPVNGKFTVSGVATDNNKLNRVYIQLINRTTGVRCGGTTINLLTSINPKEAEWSREYSSNELKNIEGCSALGNFAAHVSVTDNFGNNSSQGWTDDFLVE